MTWRAFQVFAHGPDISGRHVGGDRLDLGVRAAPAFPERFQSIAALAVADKDDRAGEQIQDDGQVAMAFADVDLIKGDLLEVVEFGFTEATLQV
jgi:hypothetical protein